MTAGSAIEQIGDLIAFVAERLLALGLIAAIVLDFVNVAGRYTGGFTLLGADEIEIDVLVWIAFVGAIAVSWRGQHLRMDVLVQSGPPAVRRVVAVAESLVILAVAGLAAVESFAYVKKLYALGVVTDILRLSTWIPNLAVAICFACMALIVIVRGIYRILAAGKYEA